MKVSPVVAATLVLLILFPGSNQEKSTRKFCVGRDGNGYLRGEHYDDQKDCIRYTCVRKGENLKMNKKKLQCDGSCSNPNKYWCKMNVTKEEPSVNSTSLSAFNNLQANHTNFNLNRDISLKSRGISTIFHRRYRRTLSRRWCFWIGCKDIKYYPQCQDIVKPYCEVLKKYEVTFHKDISQICCFIIRTSFSQVWILSDSKYSNGKLNCPNSKCRYVNFHNKYNEKCLDTLGSYSCCSQTTGSVCKKYGGTGSTDNLPETCEAAMKVGAKVVRDERFWSYGNQDGGPGSIGIITGMDNNVLFVHWKLIDHHNNYKWSQNGETDVKVYCESCDTKMKVGTTVVRNDLDWTWGDQDGGTGNKGTVTSIAGTGSHVDGWIRIKWANGNENDYRWGRFAKADIKVYCQDKGLTCSSECSRAPMANCVNDPTNKWCNDELLGNHQSDKVQSAKYLPKALKVQLSTRKKRSFWSDCPPWHAWQFDCYQAVRYMIISKGKEFFEFEGMHYFKKKCCSEFQSKCTGVIAFDKKFYQMINTPCP